VAEVLLRLSDGAAPSEALHGAGVEAALMATKPRGTRRTLIQHSRAKSPSEKASYHQLLGAGRRRVRREFFGLSDDDKSAIVAAVKAGIARNLKG
jgi:hypothetical protein